MALIVFNVICPIILIILCIFLCKFFIRNCKENYLINKIDFIAISIISIIFYFVLSLFYITYLMCIISSLLAFICYLDYKYQLIPNRLNFSLFIGGLLGIFCGIIPAENLFSSILLFSFFFLVGYILRGMGGGDIKLMAGLGFFIPFTYNGLIVFIFTSFSIALIVVLIVKKFKVKPNETFAFAPFLVIGMLISLFVG